MSDAVWLAIIGLIGLAIKEYFDRQRARDAAKKVETVASKLDDNTALTQVVMKQTNGLPDALRKEIDQLKGEIRGLKEGAK